MFLARFRRWLEVIMLWKIICKRINIDFDFIFRRTVVGKKMESVFITTMLGSLEYMTGRREGSYNFNG
jgi:hypothetical protein